MALVQLILQRPAHPVDLTPADDRGALGDLARTIGEGDLDPMLTQPRSVVAQAVAGRSLAPGWGDFLSGLLMVAVSGYLAPERLPVLVVAIALSSATVLATGVLLVGLGAAPAFRVVLGLGLRRLRELDRERVEGLRQTERVNRALHEAQRIARVGSYEEAARQLSLDRRTVKARIDETLLAKLKQGAQ